MLVFFALWGCSEPAVVQGDKPTVDEPAVAPKPLVAKEPGFTFTELAWDDAFLTNAGPTATTGALVDGVHADIDYHPLGRTGDMGFGQIFDLSGNPIEEECNQQDFDAMFEARGKLWLTSHFECTPGAIYLSELSADPTGHLSMVSTKNVDFNAHGGIYNPCAGQITPWGTHLASEEYEPDAVEEPTSLETHGWDYLSWSKMKKAAKPGTPLNPYHYGWTPEIAVMTPQGDTLAVKHKSLGRFSHEIAYVLPDERTVYLSDDGRGSGLFMFVADEAAQLASGTLYAAQFFQNKTRASGSGDVRWVNLGHASDTEVDYWISQGVTFSDLFERKLPVDGVCEAKFRFVDQDGKQECLKMAEASEKFPDPARMAGRLETRRYAGYLGATTEFEKGEGITYDPQRGVVYVAFAKIGGRMVTEAGKMAATDHIQVPANPCGAVWAGSTDKNLLDTDNRPIKSDHVMITLQTLLAGSPIEADEHGNTCANNGPANPDNIVLLPDYDLLMIAEDTKRHAVASLWSLDLNRSRLKRVMVAPPHGEITGLHWVPNMGGFGYLTVAVQHPWAMESLDGKTATLPEGVTAEHQRSIAGYLGPFPKLDGFRKP